MDEAKKHEIRQWLTKACHDMRSAERLITADPPLLDTAVYHCQQVAEKALKAYLTLQDAPFPKTHVLSLLVEQCMEFDFSFSELRDSSEILTPFAVAFRYPGDVLEPEPSDAQEAFELARLVLDFVVARMPEGWTSEFPSRIT